jgi:putative DNA primase/helicase
MLIPVGEPNQRPNPTRRANVERVRRLIWVPADDVSPGQVLVVCQQGLELELLNGPLPDTVDIAHFNALTGLNTWENLALVIVIGRTAPPVREVEQLARIMFGTQVQEVKPDENGNIRYPVTRRGIRMRDGRGIPVDGPSHPDHRVEAIRWAISEGELVQAIGRGRGVNRTEANPLEVDILTNVCLPIAVNQTITWGAIQPTLAQVMRSRGALPLAYAGMAMAYPDLFTSPEAARKALARENPGQTSIASYFREGCPGFARISYRRVGIPGPPGRLLYDPKRIDPRRWLAER